jgi:hypothetical protein
MATRYRLVYDGAAEEVLAGLPAEEARTLREFLRGLADHPFRTPSQQVRDAVDFFDRVVVTYWADHAVCELRVAALEFC